MCFFFRSNDADSLHVWAGDAGYEFPCRLKLTQYFLRRCFFISITKDACFFCFSCCVAGLQYALALKSIANLHGRINFNDSFELEFYLKKKKKRKKSLEVQRIGHKLGTKEEI